MKILSGCFVLIVTLVIAFAISGAIIFGCGWLLHTFFAIPMITFTQAVVIAIVLSIVGSYFKSTES